MSDPSIPLSMLTQFHREVIVPDIERIVGASERRLRDEMHRLHDDLLIRFERLERRKPQPQAVARGYTMSRYHGRIEFREPTYELRAGTKPEPYLFGYEGGQPRR